MKLYVASSWRNPYYEDVLAKLRAAGHECYDFRNPKPGDNGFRWSELDPAWMNWTAEQYRANLQKPLAQDGFKSDFDAMQWADGCVLVLPCGRSAHLECGWMAGADKYTFILTRDGEEPELMALMADMIYVSVEEMLNGINNFEKAHNGVFA